VPEDMVFAIFMSMRVRLRETIVESITEDTNNCERNAGGIVAEERGTSGYVVFWYHNRQIGAVKQGY